MPRSLPTRELRRELDVLQSSLGVEIELKNLQQSQAAKDWR